MAKLISKTYGGALFELAVEENKTDVFMEELQGVLQVLSENEEFSRLMNHPKIDKEEKVKVMENVFLGRISPELTGFFALIIQKGRYGEIEDIFQFFLAQVKALKGIGTAAVVTAVALSEEQKKQIETRLIETTSYQQMEIQYLVDSSLIGGMVIRIGDRIVDSSISTKLNELTRGLLKIQLQ